MAGGEETGLRATDRRRHKRAAKSLLRDALASYRKGKSKAALKSLDQIDQTEIDDDPQALFDMGHMLLMLRGTKGIPDEGIKLYRWASYLGHVRAKLNLACLALGGFPPSVEKDIYAAIALYKEVLGLDHATADELKDAFSQLSKIYSDKKFEGRDLGASLLFAAYAFRLDPVPAVWDRVKESLYDWDISLDAYYDLIQKYSTQELRHKSLALASAFRQARQKMNGRMTDANDTHSMRTDRGVPIVECSGHPVILDTGSPASFGRIGTLQIHGREFPLKTRYLNLDIDAIKRHLNANVAALIGTDILREFVATFDFASSALRLSTDQPPVLQDAIKVTDVMGVPVVSAQIEGVERPMIIDTGAALSYLVPSVAQACRSVGATMNDFMPLFGAFRTELFEGHLSVGGSTGTLQFGVLPPPLDGLLGMLGVSGVIGLNAVGPGGRLTLSLAGGWATIDRDD